MARSWWRSVPAILAAAALAGPATASGASGWVPGFDEVAPSSNVSGSVAVITPDLRTVAFWVNDPLVRAAVRPRGGKFEEPFVLDPGNTRLISGSLEAIALPDGEVLAAWFGGNNLPAELRIKSLRPDGTVADARTAEQGGPYLAIGANHAGMVAVAYFVLNEVYLAIRPAGADTFEPSILLLTVVPGKEQPGPLDLTVRDDGQVAVAIGTGVVNPPGGEARMLIARRAGGTTSIEVVDSSTLTGTQPPGTSSSAAYRGAVELLPDGRQLLVYRLQTNSEPGELGLQIRKLFGGPRDGSIAPSPPLLDEGIGAGAGPTEHGLIIDDAGRPWLWWRHGIYPGQGELRVRQATAAGAFSAPTQVLASPVFRSVNLAAFGDGRTGVLFIQDGKVKASTSEDGAAFGAPIEVATPGAVPPPTGDIVLDLVGGGEGSAVALWLDGATPQTSALHATPFDATPPTLQSLQAPSSLTAGVAGTFTATALDDWSVPGVSWLFSDGAMQDGATVQRAFPAPGSFTATATATDAVGNTASGMGTVAVTPAPAAPSSTAPSSAFTLGKPKLNKKNGTAKLPVTVPGPGTLVLTGTSVVRQAKVAKAAGTVRMLVKTKTMRKLNTTGRVRVKVKIAYMPTGGTAQSKSKNLALKKLGL